MNGRGGGDESVDENVDASKGNHPPANARSLGRFLSDGYTTRCSQIRHFNLSTHCFGKVNSEKGD